MTYWKTNTNTMVTLDINHEQCGRLTMQNANCFYFSVFCAVRDRLECLRSAMGSQCFAGFSSESGSHQGTKLPSLGSNFRPSCLGLQVCTTTLG